MYRLVRIVSALPRCSVRTVGLTDQVFVCQERLAQAGFTNLACTRWEREGQSTAVWPHVQQKRFAAKKSKKSSKQTNKNENPIDVHQADHKVLPVVRGNDWHLRLSAPEAVAADEDDDDDEEEEEDPDTPDERDAKVFSEHFPDDRNLPANYKELVIPALNSRIDKVVQRSLKLSSRDVEEIHLAGRLTYNGQHLKKRSTPALSGDRLDITDDESDPKNIVGRRVRIVKMLRRHDGDKAYVRVWRAPTTLY